MGEVGRSLCLSVFWLPRSNPKSDNDSTFVVSLHVVVKMCLCVSVGQTSTSFCVKMNESGL